MKLSCCASIALLTASCGGARTVTTSASVPLPASEGGAAPFVLDTGPEWVVSCRDGAADCAAQAKKSCPRGYVILDEAGQPVAVWLSDTPPAVTASALRGRCVEP